MINSQLLEYIKRRRAQNVGDQTIKNELLAGGGWSAKDVEEAFSTFTPASIPIKPETITSPVLKGVSAVVSTISIIFLIGLPILLGLSLTGYLFGCALSGGGSGFDCRIGLPAVAIGAAIGLIAGIKVSRSIIKTKTFKVSKIALIIFVLSIFGSYLIASLPSILNQDQRMKYLEGYSLESCSTGKSSVPWGRSSIDTDSCYAYFGKCESVKDSYSSKLYCLKKEVSSPTEYDDCKGFAALPEAEVKCRVQVAVKKNDLNFCSTFTDTATYPYLNPYLPRAYCAADVVGIDNVYAAGGLNRTIDFTQLWATPLEVKIEKCNALGGIKADICLSYVARFNKVNTCSGVSSEVPWLKQNCEDLFKITSVQPE